jgi:DNA (cytosine-5)-methyltransferase 1
MRISSRSMLCQFLVRIVLNAKCSFDIRMLCALVGMGYQVQQFLLDAWSSGDPQSRTRLFIAATAPGFVPISHPYLTHAHPPKVLSKSLGTAVNGEKFGSRRRDVTPFDFISASEATKHLPFLGDSQVQTCIPFPDHRTTMYVNPLNRYMINQIPVLPRSQGMMTTARKGLFAAPIMDYFNAQLPLRTCEKSKSWTRIDPDGLFPTFTTALQPTDGKAGYGVHWNEHRVLTVMDARIGQGIPDHEVFIGLPTTQYRIIGNSVARSVALSLGMSLREAWISTPPPIL